MFKSLEKKCLYDKRLWYHDSVRVSDRSFGVSERNVSERYEGKDEHCPFNTSEVDFASDGINGDHMVFDLEIFRAFVKGRMRGGRDDPREQHISVIYQVKKLLHISGSVIPFTVRAQSL